MYLFCGRPRRRPGVGAAVNFFIKNKKRTGKLKILVGAFYLMHLEVHLISSGKVKGVSKRKS